MFKFLRNYTKKTGWSYLHMILADRQSGELQASPH